MTSNISVRNNSYGLNLGIEQDIRVAHFDQSSDLRMLLKNHEQPN